MATPRRRSSRINSGATPDDAKADHRVYPKSKAQATPMSKLSSLLERDESPANGQATTIDTLISSPIAPPNTAATHNQLSSISSAVKTPQTASRLYPSLEEMHPSKARPSTIKPSASRQQLHSINSTNALTPSKSHGKEATHMSPSKAIGGLPKHMISPSFDFSFERPESDLSAEAQKIMESVREEAAKIKAQMLEERSKQECTDGEAEKLAGVAGRKIMKPKGKSGRYSEVHRQEFKKMDSIANHVSTWKNNIQANTFSLKRSPSKAGLDQSSRPLSKSKSFKSFELMDSSESLDNTSPAKRAKKNFSNDVSAARPVSRDTNSSLQATPVKIPTKSGLPSAVTTPTKASLARSASVKSMKTSMIPSLSRSASTKTLSGLAMPKTEGSNKYASSLSRFGSMKSILHRSQPKFSNDPAKIASGTHLPLPKDAMELDKDLPELPSSPCAGVQSTPTVKRVGFCLSPSKSRQNLTSKSSSPSKIPTSNTQPQPEVSTSPRIDTDPVEYPDLANSPNITTRTKVPRASTPGDFTFRAEKTINFSPSKDGGVTSPGSTIRHVRPSGIPTQVPEFNSIPAIPHGMPNKKRSRPDPDTPAAGDEENIDPMEMIEVDEDLDQPRAKKQRLEASSEKSSAATSPVKGAVAGSRLPKLGNAEVKGKKGISLGRLNMLARPKKH
ncbi:hypothetical protein ACLMJK_008801 [Lecanora helva]